MGEQIIYQPLSTRDRISVIIYRTGIILSTVLLGLGGVLLNKHYGFNEWQKVNEISSGYGVTTYIVALYLTVGLSVFTIHLYVKRFRNLIKGLYFIALTGLILLIVIGRGDIGSLLFTTTYAPFLLIPLSGCLGFITAKEAFCFRLHEGYFLALFMPYYLFIFSIRAITPRDAGYGLILIAAFMLFFTLRKVRMPLAYDIGDKTVYEH
jgi:uncharacterized integral membrane protein